MPSAAAYDLEPGYTSQGWADVNVNNLASSTQTTVGGCASTCSAQIACTSFVYVITQSSGTNCYLKPSSPIVQSSTCLTFLKIPPPVVFNNSGAGQSFAALPGLDLIYQN